MTRLVDLTHGFYDGMPSYPADWFPKFASERTMTPENDPYGTKRVLLLARVSHNGTHMEYRLHFFPGTEGIDEVPLHT
jgi:arylformamidase